MKTSLLASCSAFLALALSPFALRGADPGAAPVPPAARAALERAAALEKDGKHAEAAAALFEAIEADPDFIEAHDRLAQIRSEGKAIDAKYQEWLKRFPDSLGVQYGAGAWLYGKEDPGARPHLLKVLERDPKNAKVCYMLSIDADRWGDRKAAADYVRRAARLDPSNAEYAFEAAYAEEDPDRRTAALLEVERRFSGSDRAGFVLAGLALAAPDDARRIAYLERMRAELPPAKSFISSNNMPRLFAAYLRVDPAKAVAFAREMQGGENAKEWEGQLAMAQAYVEANDRLREGKAADALGLLDKLTVEKRWLSVDGVFSNGPMLVRFKAKVLARAGRAQDAYDSLLRQETSWPEDETRTALLDTGKLMGKTPVQVDADLKAALAAGSRPAPALALTEYGTGETVSLDKLRGKVVLLTFWFPGCGPCRSEMPHFEAVMKELRGKDIAFLGVNGLREQDPYVPSFMKGTGFSFTPLQGTDAVTAPAAYNVRAYPTNFIIDRSGRIVYSGFMIHDAEGEQTLKRMLESLL